MSDVSVSVAMEITNTHHDSPVINVDFDEDTDPVTLTIEEAVLLRNRLSKAIRVAAQTTQAPGNQRIFTENAEMDGTKVGGLQDLTFHPDEATQDEEDTE